ncbi:MAG TPA: outer membrane protein assembly factor BamA [Bryobacteraceae bacterium]|nr:outer membrane protein assembly factor BamA [Bryobacteraceae bacterium]
MKFSRRVSLAVAAACLCASCEVPLWCQQNPPQQTPPQQTPPQTQPAQTPPQQAPPQQTPPQQTPPPTNPPQRPANPFENVPREERPPTNPPGTPQVQRPQLETPKQAETPTTPPGTEVIESIEFRGTKRVPQDSLKVLIMSKPGDVINYETLRRDYMALWNTGRFDDIRVEEEPGRTGEIIRFVVVERRVIRSIEYPGAKSVTVSEILDRFKERKVGLSVESQYDPNKVQHAAVVLKEFLSERGHQYATVDPQIEQIPPSSLKVSFVVNEGPKVKVGSIEIEGNQAKSQKWVINAMKNSKPIGLPHSILFENLFAKTYDRAKLDEDKERVRQAYQDAGYFQAKTLEETVSIVHEGGKGWRLPLIKMNLPGIKANIDLPVEEGRLYHLRQMNFQGIKLFRTPEVLMKPLFGMTTGDVFSTEKLRKGIENMRKLYGKFGYIDFVPEPNFDIVPDSDQIDLTLTADEGKQFFIRRIDFSGNTTTRDKVIRREILLDEGDMFNTELWDYSILRLNQLGYFEMLKKEEAADIKRNPQSNTVDITLKVKERGKNSIGLNGGVSGIAGSFVGFNYSTNNFLGLGETLSLESQLGTRMRDVSLGFTEPYFLDRPLQLGFVVYIRHFNFDQGREASILSGTNLIPLYNQLGTQNLLNYNQNSRGFNVSASYPLKRSFARFGITYGYDRSNIETLTTASTNYFQYINFNGVAGPNSLTGIHTSHITMSYTYNTVNHPITPTQGRSIFVSTDFAGSILGGNVNTIRPSVDVKYFKQAPWHRSHILAFHMLASMITGYGGKYIPPYSRTFIGGEQDVRGFEIWGISPIAFIASEGTVNVLNADGTPRTQKVITNGVITSAPVTMTIPTYQLITPGGDAQTVGNFEYRIPIVGPVTLAYFVDAGLNKILRPSQLTMDVTRVEDLNNSFPQAGFDGRVRIASGTEKIRVSTGLELQVMLPVVNAPFRLYYAYNPSVVREYLQPPIVADRSYFPNNATFLNSVALYGQAYPYFEKRTMFRFTIGRTF